MADKCENRGCGVNSLVSGNPKHGINCGVQLISDSVGDGRDVIKLCKNFTTTPTQSITVERLKELEGIIEGLKDSATVYVNMLRGEIAKPQEFVELEKDRERLAGEVERLKGVDNSPELEKEIATTIYDFNLNEMPPRRIAKRIMALVTTHLTDKV